MKEFCKICGKEIPEHTTDTELCRVDVERPIDERGVYHAGCYVKKLTGEEFTP